MKKNVQMIFLIALFCFAAAPAFAEYAPKVSAEPRNPAVGHLQHLTELLTDGQEGYEISSDAVKHPELKRQFMEYAKQRADFLDAVKKEVATLGGDPNEGASVMGTAHRGWMNIRAAVTKKDDQAIVDEVLRGERAALDGYQETLNKDLPKSTRSLLEKQRSDIQKAYDRVKSIDIKQQNQA